MVLLALANLQAAYASAQVQMAEPFLEAKARVRQQDLGERLVVANPVPRDKYPWVVALVLTEHSSNFRGHVCGGTLLAANVVLTAAHCVDRVESIDEIAVVHTLNLEDASRRLRVKKIHVHDDFSRATKKADVALIVLTDPVSVAGGFPRLAKAADFTALAAEDTANVAGWGRRSPGGPKSTSLLEAPVTVMPASRCTARAAYGKEFVESDMICAGDPEIGANVCSGDSGGPLLTKAGTALLGVVSWGDGCNKPTKFGVYSRLLAYQDWFDSMLPRN